MSLFSLGHTTMRPSELFYTKLTPLLKEAGILVENRKDWPLSILVQVLQELMNETPKDLLAKYESFYFSAVEEYLSF